jgi:hypothetical protein
MAPMALCGVDGPESVFYRAKLDTTRFFFDRMLPQIEALAGAIEGEFAEAGETSDRPGATYSDLTQRLLPMLVLDAYPDWPLCFARAVELARATVPTPAFRDEAPAHRLDDDLTQRDEEAEHEKRDDDRGDRNATPNAVLMRRSVRLRSAGRQRGR